MYVLAGMREKNLSKGLKQFHLPNLLLKKNCQLIQRKAEWGGQLVEGKYDSIHQMEKALTDTQPETVSCAIGRCVYMRGFSVCVVCLWSIVLETHCITTGPKCHINADASMSEMVLCGVNERISDLDALQQPARGSKSSWSSFFEHKLETCPLHPSFC